MLSALIFDVDGTLADTESAHRAAFNEAFAEVGRDWIWDEALYTRLLEVSGGKERILHYWQQIQPDLKQIGSSGVQDTVNRMHELKTADWMHYFSVVEDASTAPQKKPHPQVYLQTLKRLQVPVQECLAFEDSANGLKAAVKAGLATLITPNSFTAHHDFTGALRVLPTLQGVTVAHLREWHASNTAVAATTSRSS